LQITGKFSYESMTLNRTASLHLFAPPAPLLGERLGEGDLSRCSKDPLFQIKNHAAVWIDSKTKHLSQVVVLTLFNWFYPRYGNIFVRSENALLSGDRETFRAGGPQFKGSDLQIENDLAVRQERFLSFANLRKEEFLAMRIVMRRDTRNKLAQEANWI